MRPAIGIGGRGPIAARVGRGASNSGTIGRIVAATTGAYLASLFFCGSASSELIHLRIDPGTTQIVATVKEPLTRFRGAASGAFTVIRGTVDGDTGKPAKGGRVEIVMDAASYNSGDTRRDEAVKRETLEAARFPVITFVSTRIENFEWEEKRADATSTIVGNLTLHGVTREVRIPIDAVLSPSKQLSVDGDLRLQMADFNIAPPSTLFGALRTGKAVYLSFRIIAAPENQLPTVPPK
ncbi:MAG: YceI family protein [Deltaproteobacteria bacterium]|nr:YceI family protein [Deltaproteobacteria bacterium]